MKNALNEKLPEERAVCPVREIGFLDLNNYIVRFLRLCPEAGQHFSSGSFVKVGKHNRAS